MDWLIDDIDTAKTVDEYVVISNHKFAHHFETWAKNKKQKITVVDDGTDTNETRLGAVCDIRFAIDKLNLDDDILVIAGDNVLDFSLTQFIAYVKKKQTSCIMRYYEPDEKKLLKCGVVTIDENDKICKMTEKSPTPETHWCCPPFFTTMPRKMQNSSKKVSTAVVARMLPEVILHGSAHKHRFTPWKCPESDMTSGTLKAMKR